MASNPVSWHKNKHKVYARGFPLPGGEKRPVQVKFFSADLFQVATPGACLQRVHDVSLDGRGYYAKWRTNSTGSVLVGSTLRICSIRRETRRFFRAPKYAVWRSESRAPSSSGREWGTTLKFSKRCKLSSYGGETRAKEMHLCGIGDIL